MNNDSNLTAPLRTVTLGKSKLKDEALGQCIPPPRHVYQCHDADPNPDP